MALDDGGDFGQRIQDAGRGFAVDEADVGDRRVGFRRRSTSAGVVGTSSAVSNVVTLRPIICVSLASRRPYAPLMSTSTWPERGTRVLIAASTGKRAAALQRDAHVRFLAVDDGDELLAHLAGDGVEVGVPRSPVAEHRHFRGERRGDGAGRQQDRIARKEAHGLSFRSGGERAISKVFL